MGAAHASIYLASAATVAASAVAGEIADLRDFAGAATNVSTTRGKGDRTMNMFAMVAAAVLLIAGLSIPAPAADPIKIGFIGSITGYGSILGDPEVKAAKLRAKTINAAGGINGRPWSS